MALAEVTASFLRRCNASQARSPLMSAARLQCRGYASEANDKPTASAELEETDFITSAAPGEGFDPVKRSRAFGQRLPSSGFRLRPAKYDRGPLNRHRPPKASDPHSREFVAGPFSLPRLQQTYNDTFSSDLMVLYYQHRPPGFEAPKKSARLRQWTGDSPYFKNRPLRGPRGGDTLRLLRKPINFNNIPQLERVTVHSMVKGALDNPGHLTVAAMALQAITGARAMTKPVKRSVSTWGLKKGAYVSLTSDIYGEDMYHFLSKLVEVVMPKIKDYKGIKGSSGDSSGNLTFGFTAEQFALFPEIEVNIDAYPPKMMPGCHVTIHTSATTDKDARMLLAAIGVPFYGKMVN